MLLLKSLLLSTYCLRVSQSKPNYVLKEPPRSSYRWQCHFQFTALQHLDCWVVHVVLIIFVYCLFFWLIQRSQGLYAPCLQLNLFALLLFLVGLLGWLAGVSVWQLVNSQLFVLYYVHYADRSFISRMIIAIFHTGRLMRGFTGKLGGFMQHNFFRPFLKVFGGWEHDYALPVYLPSSDSTHGQENDLSQVLLGYNIRCR